MDAACKKETCLFSVDPDFQNRDYSRFCFLEASEFASAGLYRVGTLKHQGCRHAAFAVSFAELTFD